MEVRLCEALGGDLQTGGLFDPHPVTQHTLLTMP